MAQKASDSYPSPTAAQAEGVVSPYQQNHQDPQDTLDLNTQLQNAAGNAAPHEGASTDMNSGAGLASAVAQHMNTQESYYAQPPQASTPQPYQGQIPGISAPLAPTPGDESARKKTKVTRACDECRRKKIKCDAESDGPNTPRCSNCQRTNAECKFSRAPQKRGPSKGYIKELSDRVAQLESVGRGVGFSDFEQDSPVPMGSMNERKRTFSMTDPGLYDPAILDKFRPEPAKSFAPVAVPEAHMQPASTDAPTKSKSLGIQLATPETFPPQPLRPLHKIEQEHLETFLNRVNKFFPLLGSRDGINANLQFCPPPLRQAFYYAIGSVVGAIERNPREQTRDDCADHVYHMMNTTGPPGPLSEQMNPPASRTWQANLVYLQTLILLVLHQETGGQMLSDPIGNFTKDQLLQQARRFVDHLQLRHVTEAAHLGTGSEATRIFSAARRAYWIFVVLDIWNSISNRSTRQLPLMSVDAELTVQDRAILGDEFYHLVRRSSVVAMMSDQLKVMRVRSADMATMGYWMYSMQHASLANADPAVMPTMKTAPLAMIAQSTTDLFCALLMAGPTHCPPTQDIVERATAVTADLLAADIPEGIPLVHHFVVAAAKVLIDASHYQRPATRAGLQNILVAVRSKGLLDTNPWREAVAAAAQDRLEDEKGGIGGMENGDAALLKADLVKPWPVLVWEGYLREAVIS